MTDGLSDANRNPECPGPECSLCARKACNLCRIRPWGSSYGQTMADCPHDDQDRHGDPIFGARKKKP